MFIIQRLTVLKRRNVLLKGWVFLALKALHYFD
jgi:hypothetical protein